MNKLKSEKGLTLVELLAVITLISTISIFSFALLANSSKNFSKISADTVLRDEADIILTRITSAIYTSKDSEIIFFSNNISHNHYIFNEKSIHSITGFKDNKIYIQGEEYITSNKDVAIDFEQSSILETEFNQNLERSFKIQLTLENTQKNTTRTFKTEVRTINDITKEVK